MVREYAAVEPHMIDGVPYQSRWMSIERNARKSKDDRDVNLDLECLHFNINEDDLLDDLKSIHMMET